MGHASGMSDEPSDQYDPRRIRAGLVILGLVVLVAAVLAILLDEGLARLIMLAIIVFTVVRMFLLTRRVRRDARRSS
jgi:uncharacterized membrane protein